MTEEKKRELLEEGLKHLGTPVTQELRRFAESALRGYLWRGKKEKRHIRRYMCSLCGAEFESDDRYPDDIYKEACRRAGMDRFVGCHTLRKTYGYTMYRRHHDVGQLMEHFNHSSQDVTLRYIGISQQNKDKWADEPV